MKTAIAQIGIGGWGPNLLRNFSALSECEVKYVCDLSAAQWDKLAGDYPGVKFTPDYRQILSDDGVTAVVVATPVPTHFELAKKALLAGKHVYVEKPITLDADQAEELIRLVAKTGKKLMVGHLMLYHPAVNKLKELILAGELGPLCYLYTRRLNLGKIRNTENAMWSLAPHDLSIVLYLTGKMPQSVAARGAAFVQPKIEDVVFIDLKFPDGMLAQVQVSWLDPTKTRGTTVIGSKKMAVFNELKNELILVDKSAAFNPATGEVSQRIGADQKVAFDAEEPLRRECAHFIDCVRNGQEPLSNGENGLAVLKVLAAAQRSLEREGSNELL